MKPMKARELFAPVDPHLTVIDGGVHRRKGKRDEQEQEDSEASPGHSWAITEADWLAAGGTLCPRCEEETVKLRPQDKLCPRCAELADEKTIRDEKKRAKFLKYRKAHNARIRS